MLWFFRPGLKVLGQNIPEGIVTGTYPATCRLPTRRGKGGKAPASYSGLPADPRKVRFSPEDLDKISYYLDQSLIPQDTGSEFAVKCITERSYGSVK